MKYKSPYIVFYLSRYDSLQGKIDEYDKAGYDLITAISGYPEPDTLIFKERIC